MFRFLNKVTDPVCKMKMDKNKTKLSGEFEGEKYYFCSENCKNKFNTSPKDYAKKNAAEDCCQSKTNATTAKSCC